MRLPMIHLPDALRIAVIDMARTFAEFTRHDAVPSPVRGPSEKTSDELLGEYVACFHQRLRSLEAVKAMNEASAGYEKAKLRLHEVGDRLNTLTDALRQAERVRKAH